MMRAIRKIADERDWTIEEVMDRALVEFVERRHAEAKLETKIITFPVPV